MLVTKLGIFDYKSIISKEELDTIEHINNTENMPIFAKEILMGPMMALRNLNDDNNNKFKNLLFLQEDEQ
jgi:hypothetical protein